MFFCCCFFCLDFFVSFLLNRIKCLLIAYTFFQELSSLQSKLGTTTMDTSVSMIEVDTLKSFDVSKALNKMRMEYDKSVQQHREEADAYYKLKVSMS